MSLQSCALCTLTLAVLKCWVVILLLGPGAIRVRGRLAAVTLKFAVLPWGLSPQAGVRWKQLSQAGSTCFFPSCFQGGRTGRARQP